MIMRLPVFLTILLMCLNVYSRELPLPQVPDTLRQPKERAAYIMLHFWDDMDWRDSTLTADDQFMEQNAANFYSLFPHADSISASAAVEVMLHGASADMSAYRRVADIAALYLNDPASPMIDDESYAVVADRLLANRKLGEADLLRLEDAHNALMLNRKGAKATDFAIITREGERMTLSEAANRSARSLLIFYDPDCHDCAVLEEQLAKSCPADTGVIMVSMLGDEGEDTAWKEHADTMPAGWIVSYPDDDDFADSDLYYIPATPTVYLLDRDCIVLAKNIKAYP